MSSITFTGAADFEPLDIVPRPDPAIGRIGRITNNSRNLSHATFRFGGETNTYKNEKERYDTDVVKHEKLSQQHNAERKTQRYEFRQQWLCELEQQRWQKMAAEDLKQQALWEKRHQKTRVGANSVGYNPITLEYYTTAKGKNLAESDTQLVKRAAARAACSYMRSNTYDPIKGKDVTEVKVISAVGPTTPGKGGQGDVTGPTAISRVKNDGRHLGRLKFSSTTVKRPEMR
ncbi:hypothetical protein BJ742DRAFT_207653 [Cladochytrium replicatum]|nr:hypothetical protein BJ742DRAFT_207653 [Cladochytrium replicatum]